MIQKIILHIGPPKTATTSIQSALSSISEDLRENGIFYPDTDPPSTEGHPSLAWDIMEYVGQPVARLSKAYVGWNYAFEKAKELKSHTLLLSSEDFFLFNEDAIKALRNIIGDIPITLICGIRDPLNLIPSFWQQSVKWGIGLGEEILEIDDAILFIINNRMRIIPYIETFRQITKCELLFIIVDNTDSEKNTIRRFSKAICLPYKIAEKFCSIEEAKTKNRSLSYKNTCMLLKLNRMIYEENPYNYYYPENVTYQKIMARSLIIDLLPNEPKNAFPLSPKSYHILTHERNKISKFLGKFSNVIGNFKNFHYNSYNFYHKNQSNDFNYEDIDKLLLEVLVRALPLQSSRLIELHDYLHEVEKARDWWKQTSERWENIVRSTAWK